MQMNVKERALIVKTIKKTTSVIDPLNYSNDRTFWGEMGGVIFFINYLSDMLEKDYEDLLYKSADINLIDSYNTELDRMIDQIKLNEEREKTCIK